MAGKAWAIARAAASTSGASNTAVITATALAPARISARRIGGGDAADRDDRHAERTRGTRAARFPRAAPVGLTDDGKKLPNAT